MRHVEIKHVQIAGSAHPFHPDDTKNFGSSVTFELGPGETLHGLKDKFHTVMVVCGHCQRKTFYREAPGNFQCGSCQRIYDVHGEQIG